MLDTDWLVELFSPFGTPSVRRMFGGQGVYLDGVMVALVADGVLYLKSDAETAHAFDAAGLDPFTYVGKDERRTVMSYRRAPPAALDDPQEMGPWVDLARAAAGRALVRKKPRSPRVRPARTAAGAR
jgi:DNA transformation protein